MDAEKMDKFHKIVTVELLSTIDHKVRGIQQFVVALRGLIEEDVLDDLKEETEELQAIYESYLKLRNINLEEVEIGKFLKDNYNIKTEVSCITELDRDKLSFVFDTLIDFCGRDNYTLSVAKAKKGCVINIVSPSFAELSIDDFQKLSDNIEVLPFFAIQKTLVRMGGTFSVQGDVVSIELIKPGADDA